MIKDLEKEVVALRNFTEQTAWVLRWLIEGEGQDTEDILGQLRKAQNKYQKHRCDRWEDEVEGACKVLKKNYELCGCEVWGHDFVPREMWEEVFERNKKLQEENENLRKIEPNGKTRDKK